MASILLVDFYLHHYYSVTRHLVLCTAVEYSQKSIPVRANNGVRLAF